MTSPIDLKDQAGDSGILNLDARLAKIALVAGVSVTLLSAALISGLFALSFALGSLLSYFNFSWMKQGIDRLLVAAEVGAAAEEAPKPSFKIVIFKYFLRYALLGGALYAIFRFRFLDPWGASLGLFLYVIAVLIECVYQVCLGLSGKGDDGRT